MKQAVLATVMAGAIGVVVVAQGAATRALPLDNLGLEHLDIIVHNTATSTRLQAARIIPSRSPGQRLRSIRAWGRA